MDGARLRSRDGGIAAESGEHARASDPRLTLGVELIAQGAPALWFEVPDVPATVAGSLSLDDEEKCIFEDACRVLHALGQDTFRSIAVWQPAHADREILLRITVGLGGEPAAVGDANLDGGRPARLMGGVRAHLPIGATDGQPHRLLLSRGTTSPPWFETDGPPYRPEATVPRLPWRVPTAGERRLLGQETGDAPYAHLAVVRLDDVVLAPLRHLDFAEAETLRDVEALRRNPCMPAALAEVGDALWARHGLLSARRLTHLRAFTGLR